jgi:hypothetical protein
MSFNFPDHMQVSVRIPRDEKGMMGRECPKCELIFKIRPGTGLKGKDLPCRCAYCGHVANHDQFWTKEQIEYAKSVALHEFVDQFHDELKKLEFDHPPRGPFGIGISLKLTTQTYPLRYYHEPKLETDVVCERCTLVYAIYGAFAFCPDCGSHNSFTILCKNLELAEKMLALAGTQEPDFAEHLVGDALENVVSALDGFGREICKVATSKATNPAGAEEVRFQNLVGARGRIQKLFGFDLTTFVPMLDWEFACRCFQKRHLLAHKMGVIDDNYVQATKDPAAVVGRKVHISPDEVKRLIDVVRQLGERLTGRLLPPPTTGTASYRA